MKTLNKHALAELLRESHIYNFWIMDEEYAITVPEYLTGVGLRAYHAHLARILQAPVDSLYVKEAFDCEDFAIGYRQFLVMMHRRYHKNMKAGLAVGFGIHRMLHHALVLAVIKEKGKLCVKIYESVPTRGLVDVSGSVVYSQFSVVAF